LYNQLIDRNYSIKDIEYVDLAYGIAIEAFNGIYRGSGKPFICHLIGVASILVHIGRPVETVVAGLLHAAIADGDFGYESAQERIIKILGFNQYDLIKAYTNLQYSYDLNFFYSRKPYKELDSVVQEVILIRIANEVEDYSDSALNYYAPSVIKGFNWRVDYIVSVFPEAAKFAEELGQNTLASCVHYVCRNIATSKKIPLESNIRKSGKIFRIIPRSLREKYSIKFYRYQLRVQSRVYHFVCQFKKSNRSL